jgi:hypothetical protein
MVLASRYDQSRFLRAEDVPQDRKLRIKKTTEEMVGNGADREKKLCIWFTSDRRGLALNRTNNRTIRSAFGDETNGWIEKDIVVFSTTTEFRGKIVPALRVRIPAADDDVGKAEAKPPKSSKSKPSKKEPEQEINEDDSDVADDLEEDPPW